MDMCVLLQVTISNCWVVGVTGTFVTSVCLMCSLLCISVMSTGSEKKYESLLQVISYHFRQPSVYCLLTTTFLLLAHNRLES